MLPAEPDDLSAHEHHFKAKDVVGGQPIFQAMHPARVLTDVTAYRAGDLGGRVWRIIKACVLDSSRNREVRDAGLNACAAVRKIDFQHRVELAHAKQDAICQRHGTARK